VTSAAASSPRQRCARSFADRDRLAAPAVHTAVEFGRITRLDVVGGYPVDTTSFTNPPGDIP
jgi:hypothetical protein